MKIYFIGMPGSGKTTLGKQVASELLMQYVDLDQDIEQHEQRTIPEIFSQSGEDHFRQTESALLHKWAGSDTSFVMATGGGAPCFYQGMDVIEKTGVSVFLDVSLEELTDRVLTKTNRPLVNGNDREEVKAKLTRLLQARIPFYQRATFTIRNPTLDKVLEKLRLEK